MGEKNLTQEKGKNPERNGRAPNAKEKVLKFTKSEQEQRADHLMLRGMLLYDVLSYYLVKKSEVENHQPGNSLELVEIAKVYVMEVRREIELFDRAYLHNSRLSRLANHWLQAVDAFVGEKNPKPVLPPWIEQGSYKVIKDWIERHYKTGDGAVDPDEWLNEQSFTDFAVANPPEAVADLYQWMFEESQVQEPDTSLLPPHDPVPVKRDDSIPGEERRRRKSAVKREKEAMDAVMNETGDASATGHGVNPDSEKGIELSAEQKGSSFDGPLELSGGNGEFNFERNINYLVQQMNDLQLEISNVNWGMKVLEDQLDEKIDSVHNELDAYIQKHTRDEADDEESEG